jgi:hypothetical protein
MLSDPELLRTLKNRQTLKNLSIMFESQWLEDQFLAEKCFMPLKGFRNLTSLELYNFYGNETRLVRDVVNVLVDCPNLKALGLGLLCDCDTELLPEIVILEGECEFLEKLCLRFESQRGSPLKLHTLRLGTGMCLFHSSSPEGINFLAKLVDLSGLKCLHVFNDLVKYDIDDDGWGLEIDWHLLNDCTDLQQLSVSRLGEDVAAWLNENGSVQELIITHHYGMYDEDLANFNKLFLPHLTALFFRERFTEKRADENAWSDTDSWTTDELDEQSIYSVSVDSDPDDSDSADSNSSDTNVKDSDSSSDSGTEKPNKSITTVLDRLPDGGHRLERLSLCLDLETQWVSLRFLFSLH